MIREALQVASGGRAHVRRSPSRTRRPARALASPPAVSSSHVLAVEFEAEGGRRWSAIGGGASVEDSIRFACESAPVGPAWQVVGWRNVLGD